MRQRHSITDQAVASPGRGREEEGGDRDETIDDLKFRPDRLSVVSHGAAARLFSDGLLDGSLGLDAARIRRLELVHCSLSEGRGYQILTALTVSPSLGGCPGGANITELRLWGCGLGDGGVDLLTSTLRRCPNLRRVSLPLCNLDDAMVEEILPAVRQLPRLEDLALHSNLISRGGCASLAALLRDPECQLRHVNIDANDIDDTCAALLAGALRHNARLESLCLAGNQHALAFRGWDAFRRLLCDDSSVAATYRSNHALKSVGDPLYEHDGLVPPRIAHCLEYNRSCRSWKEAAMCKILWVHEHLPVESFFELELKMLPLVIAWFERARACTRGFGETIDRREWTATYEFARAMPMGFVRGRPRAGAKRRRCERSWPVVVQGGHRIRRTGES
ncbi:hypothetical protein ACHAXT_012870 [Thalassiosira profunda]